MSNIYLKDLEVQDKIRKLWKENPTLAFFGKMRKCVRFYKMYCIRKAVEGRQEEARLRQLIEDMVKALQSDQGNIDFQSQLAQLTKKLQSFEVKKVNGQRIRGRVKWLQVGGKCSKEFFQVFRQKSSAAHTTALEDEWGQIQTNQTALGQVCHEYYKKLYTSREPPLVVEEVQLQALRCVKDVVSRKAKSTLGSPITLHELHDAMEEMAIGKSPGLDGIILDFFKIFWDVIGFDYWSMINLSIPEGRFPKEVT